MKEPKEAFIRIGGVTLDLAQSITIRVALNDFLLTLNDPEIDLGPIADGYKARVREILHLIHADIREQEDAEPYRIS